MRYEFILTDTKIEDYENGTVQRLMSRVGKIGLKEITKSTDYFTVKGNHSYYRYVWIIESGKEEMAEEMWELLTSLNII